MNHFTYRSAEYDLGEDDAGFFEWRRGHAMTLGHDVWIGHGVTVLPGVRLGDGAAIGAGAVITKDVPPFAIVVGVPGRVLRFRFAPDIVASLEHIRWWDWPHDLLCDRLADFRRLGAQEFRRR